MRAVNKSAGIATRPSSCSVRASGTIEASKVKVLEKLDCVDYVRVMFTYEAEYPPDDPRDTNQRGGLE